MDIDNCAFQGCLGLTEIIIPSTVTFIGDWAFDGCFGLKVLCLPQQIRTKSLGDFIFRSCVSLAEMTIPNGVELIGWGAFQGCVSLKYISFPGTVRYIRKDAFHGCASLSRILFRGTPQQWEKITIEEGNGVLTAAKKYTQRTPRNANSSGVGILVPKDIRIGRRTIKMKVNDSILKELFSSSEMVSYLASQSLKQWQVEERFRAYIAYCNIPLRHIATLM